MKLAVISSVWKRPGVTRACFELLKESLDNSPHEITAVVVAVSEEWAADLCDELGFVPIMAENDPLGAKMNLALEGLLAGYDFDYMMQVDSDTILTDDFWAVVQTDIDAGFSCFGFNTIYMVNSETCAAMEFDYKCMCCAGRMIRRDVLEKAAQRKLMKFLQPITTANFIAQSGEEKWVTLDRVEPFINLGVAKLLNDKVHIMYWPSHFNSHMGNSSEEAVHDAGFPTKMLDPQLPCVIDVKTPDNIWTWQHYTKRTTYYTEIDIDDINCDMTKIKELCGQEC